MSLRIDTSEWISGAYIIGETGLGVLGANIPSTGNDGASFLYNDLSLPADNAKEIRALILTWPSAGVLKVNEDGSFSFTGAPDGTYTFTYDLYVDGVLTGSTATVTLTVGSSMNANGVAVATMSASLTTGIRMAAGQLSVATSSASLTTAITMAASAVCVASGTASLSTNSTTMAANGVSQATATASLTTSILMSAIQTAVATGSATLTTHTPSDIDPAARLTITFIADTFSIVQF